MLENIERLISEVNQIHRTYAADYFDTGRLEKINLSRTIDKIPVEHILDYRTYFNDSINYYLMAASLSGMEYFYRVKTSESINKKIAQYENNAVQYPLNAWLSDVFGCRIVLEKEEIEAIEDIIDDWTSLYGVKDWYKIEKEGYRAFHICFKNKNNYFFPWELQIWEVADVENNIKASKR
ncbi:MAG: hypothetical protein FWG67_01560 [Defluviitaleaceae bacterium]|nr:hypothetical protein [Defluviitaleaceae bacterium]